MKRLLPLFAFFSLISAPAHAEVCTSYFQNVDLPALPEPLRNYLSTEKFQSRLVTYSADPDFTTFYNNLDAFMDLPKTPGMIQMGVSTLERKGKYLLNATLVSNAPGKMDLLFEVDSVRRLLVLKRDMGPPASVVLDLQMAQLSIVQKLFQSSTEKELTELTIEWKLGRNVPKELSQSLNGLGFDVKNTLSKCDGKTKVLLALVGGGVGANAGAFAAYLSDDALGSGDDPYGKIPYVAPVTAGALGWGTLKLFCGKSKTRAGGFKLTFQRLKAKD